MSPEEKVCEGCHKVFCRPLPNNRAKWAKRKYCSLMCAARRSIESGKSPLIKTLDVGGKEARSCPLCGDAILKRSTMSWASWRRKKYCSSSCAMMVVHKEKSGGERAAAGQGVREEDSFLKMTHGKK